MLAFHHYLKQFFGEKKKKLYSLDKIIKLQRIKGQPQP